VIIVEEEKNPVEMVPE
jgi:hypothetical protein